jgi:parvulin-like peptidyl-prolyl isomerase
VALLQRHLLLQDVEEKEKQEVFLMYQPQLVQYEISVILLPTRKDGKFVLTALADKVPFEKLASDLSVDPSKSQGGRLGLLNLPQIRRFLGDDAANQVKQMKPNTTSKIVTSPHGLLVIKLGQVRATYDQLKPAVENLIADSKRVSLAYRLGQSAKITSPFLTTTPLPAADVKPQGIVPEEVEK